MQIVFYFLYTIVWTLLVPILTLLALTFIPKWKSGLKMKLGIFDNIYFPPKPIWFHAVSVGELNALLPLLRFFAGIKIVMSVTTETAYKLAHDKLHDDIENNRIQVFYMPWDHPFIVKKVVSKIDPSALIVMESEIWPALFREVKKQNASLIIINAKLSDSSFYAYSTLSFIFRDIFKQVDLFFAQAASDSRKFLQMGVNSEQIYMMGNMKFSALPNFDERKSAELKEKIGYQEDDFLIVCGSTHEEEEALLISIFQELKTDMRKDFDNQSLEKFKLIIAPRHPERFHIVADLINSAAKLIPIKYSEIKTGKYQNKIEGNDVLLIDSIGDLFDIYSIANLAFVGGTINQEVGGHNVLEPAVCRVPVLIGPYFHKNRAMVEMMEEAEAIYVAESKEDLRKGFQDLITSADKRVVMASNGKNLTNEHKKIVHQISEKLKDFLFKGVSISL